MANILHAKLRKDMNKLENKNTPGNVKWHNNLEYKVSHFLKVKYLPQIPA